MYKIPVEKLVAAGVNGRQYELQSKSWDKVQDFLSRRNVRAIHDGRVAPDFVSSTIRGCHSRQVLDADVVSGAESTQ